ncbi:FAD/NAD(P)-binding domain-containing protein [Rhizodiscina lignyota]|uniref:FAD/NAD(P)-binding domain-containing protein n=1 Tax=Rhizodiscina lignyota TaxID=1504668 RepID=A0A9P4IU60_9PEZI|nr:FAD/NAD(P)-binding domain-containing protein [Rhizodiscina lignyota]
MSNQNNSKDFKVLIAGAGIAGLTLANCLELAGIDYLLLEAKDVIAPTLGAGVALGAMSLPVLDQIGVIDEFHNLTISASYMTIHSGDGSVNMHYDTLRLGEIRTGYRRGFLEGGEVLKMLHDQIPNKEQKVLRNKQISKVAHTKDGVTVHCTDGSTYDADLIAGTDGVHSKVRAEMWRSANEQEPGAIPESDQKLLTATFNTMYGVCTPIEGLDSSSFHFIFSQGLAILYAVAQNDRAFFGVWKKMDKKYEVGSKRYSSDDADRYAKEIGDTPLLPNGAMKFRDIYKHATHLALVPTEEGIHEHCIWGRFAMLGDSVHKVTPSNGEGANIAITSAAALTNTLKELLERSKGRKPTYDELKKALKEEYMDPRQEKIASIVGQANQHTRVITRDNFIIRFLLDYIMPNYGPDGGFERIMDMEIAPDILNFVPVPERAINGTMGYNKLLGAGNNPDKAAGNRWLLALPFIGLMVLAVGRMDPTNALGEIMGTLQKGSVEWSSGSIPVYDSFFGIKAVDDFVKVVTTFFAPWTLGYDQIGSWQALQFLVDVAPLYAIMLFESNRRGNVFTPLRIPVLFALAAQYLGAGFVFQLYYFFAYAMSPLRKYNAADNRLTDLQYTKTVLPAVVLGFYLPTYLSLAVPTNIGPFSIGPFTFGPTSLETRYWWSYVWQLFPVWVWAIQKFLAWGFVNDTVRWDRLYAPKRDLPFIRTTVYGFSAVSAAMWWYNLTQCPFSLYDVYVPVWTPPADFIQNIDNFMKWDYILIYTGCFLWLALLFRDLKTWEMLRASWLSLILTAAVTIAATGPGGAAALAWLWREETMASEKMKGTLTKDGWKGVEGGEIRPSSVNGKVNDRKK